MILTINEIIKRFRTEGQCYKFKPQTITYMASKLGYTKKRFGGKIGYDQSLITAITRHFNEAVDYDKGLGMKVPQKPLKQPNMGDYYTYNGERDNIDYDWEKNENKNMILYVNNGSKKIYINESQLMVLNETGDLTPNANGTMDFKIDPIKFGTKTAQDSENQFADTRFFGSRDDILKGDGTLNRSALQTNYRVKLSLLKLYKSALSIIKGRANASELYVDNYTDKKSLNTAQKYIKNKNVDGTIAAIERMNTELNMIQNQYKKIYHSDDENFKLSTRENVPALTRYNVGLVPGTDVKVIGLFKFSNFNFSDAIKNGNLRQDDYVRQKLGVDKDNIERNEKIGGNGVGTYKKIDATYDNGRVLKPSISNNFSLNDVDLSAYDSDDVKAQNNPDHFKYQYNTTFDKNGDATSDYSSVSQFMDKSIMAAAYALRKENVKVDYILAAPSSSKYNHYYCINLSRKLGVQYNPRFFTRNLINVKFDEEACRKAGIDEKLINSTKNVIKSAAINEISSYLMAEVKRFVKENWSVIQTIPIENGGKRGAPATRITFNLACEIMKKYCYFGLSNIGAYNGAASLADVKKYKLSKSHQSINFGKPKTTNVFKYLVRHFGDYVNTNDSSYENIQTIVPKLFDGMLARGLSLKIQHMMRNMTNIVNTYEDVLLSEKGYKLSYSKKFKITDIDKRCRPYIKDAYVVADKELAYAEDDKLDALRSSLRGKYFLIVDEDMNSGGTLKLLIEALKDKPIEFGGEGLEKIASDQITCLVNLWTL